MIAQTPDALGLDESRAAFEGLALLGGEKSKVFLIRTAGIDVPVVRPLAIAALASIDLLAAANKAADLLAAAKTGDDLSELFASFLTRKGGSAALAKALDGKKLNADVAKL